MGLIIYIARADIPSPIFKNLLAKYSLYSLNNIPIQKHIIPFVTENQPLAYDNISNLRLSKKIAEINKVLTQRFFKNNNLNNGNSKYKIIITAVNHSPITHRVFIWKFSLQKVPL